MPALTDTAVRNAKPRPKPYRISDGDSLYLWVSPTGTKSWQLRYTLGTRQMTASLGKYPAVPILKARKKAQEARELASDGKHVTAERRAARANAAVAGGNTFKVVAADWVEDEARRRSWSSGHKDRVTASLDNHLGRLASLPVTAINALICSPELRKIEATAPEAARKVRQRLRSILDSAVERGFIPSNPLPATRRGIKGDVKHLPSVLSTTGVGEIMRNAERTDVCKGVQRAHMLCTFTAQRIGEVVGAEWSEVDFDAGTWTIPRARMKCRDARRGPHVVPLPPGLVAQMREWHRIDQGTGYLCPAPTTGRHITRESVEKYYRRTLKLADIHSPHAWRSVFSTWSRNAGKDRDAIEKQLDHAVGNEVQQAYDRADRLDIRREIVKAHEQTLLAARDGAQVINIAQRRA